MGMEYPVSTEKKIYMNMVKEIDIDIDMDMNMDRDVHMDPNKNIGKVINMEKYMIMDMAIIKKNMDTDMDMCMITGTDKGMESIKIIIWIWLRRTRI